jgi:predicted MFS family arabinose efflux permease
MAAAGKRIFFGWWVVGASMLAMSAGAGPLGMASFGLLMLPLQQEFGWSRAELSWSLTLLNAASAFSLILVGRLVDIKGARAVILPCFALMALCLVAIPLLVSEIWHLWALFLLMGIVGAATNSVTYVPVLSAWFNRRRGLALGLAMSGFGAGYAYVPVLVQAMIERVGWRGAYVGLSLIVVLVAIPAVYWLLIEKPQDRGMAADGVALDDRAAAEAPSGLTTGQALRTREFWLLTLIFSLMTTIMYGLFTHLVPMLGDRGVSPGVAAIVASTMGLTTFGGRILVGFIVDEIFGPVVLFCIVMLAAAGILVLSLGLTGPMMFVAAALIGTTIGAEADLLAYLASRYFGTRSLATIFGFQVAAYMGGVALGPAVFGMGYEVSQSYDPVLKACLGGLLIILLLTALLRRYPAWHAEPDPVLAVAGA